MKTYFVPKRLIQSLSNNKMLVSFLLIAFVLRIAGFIIYLKTGGTGIEPDTESYLIPAISMKTNFQFGNSAFRTPGYPFLLMVVMSVFGESFYYGLVAIQILLNMIAIFYVYKICLLLTQKEQIGYIAVAIASLNFLDILYCYQILTDSVAQSVMVISVYYFLCYLKSLKQGKSTVKNPVIASVFLTFSVFIRPATVYLPYAIMIGLIFASIIYKRYKHILLIFMCITLLINTPVMLWINRNERVVGFDGYSTVSSVNMYTYNAAAVYAKQNEMSYYDALSILQSEEDPILQEYMQTMSPYDAYSHRGWEIISSDFPYYLQCCLKDCIYLTIYPGAMSLDFVSEGISDLVTQIKDSAEISVGDFFRNKEGVLSFCILGINVLALVVIFVFAVLGLLILMKKDWLQASFLAGILLYNYVAMCQPMGIGTFARFRLSFSMILCLCAAYGLYIAFQKTKQRKA